MHKCLLKGGVKMTNTYTHTHPYRRLIPHAQTHTFRGAPLLITSRSASITYTHTHTSNHLLDIGLMMINTHTHTHTRTLASLLAQHTYTSWRVSLTHFGGRLDASFICLSAGVVEWQLYCFVIILLHYAPSKMTSVLMLFVIFRGLF